MGWFPLELLSPELLCRASVFSESDIPFTFVLSKYIIYRSTRKNNHVLLQPTLPRGYRRLGFHC